MTDADESAIVMAIITEVSDLCHRGKWRLLDQRIRCDPFDNTLVTVALLRCAFMVRDKLPRYADNVERAYEALEARGEDARRVLVGLYPPHR
ncbi:MAG: hypothetical protein EOO77_45415 [Oxalobacteraceae bacterium]|nr:MAG: hypothetical protein EOO77_45415 [Oxalobacteraceae bacterium]